MNAQSPTPNTQPDDSARGLNSPWFKRHAAIAPFGVFIVAWLMCWSDTGNWRCWSDWSETSSLVDYAVIIYGMIAVLFEKGLDVMFWALEQRKKRMAAFRAEMMAEGLAKGRADGIAEGRAAGIAEGRAEGMAQGRAEAWPEILAELQAKAALDDDGKAIADWLERVTRELEDSKTK